MGSLRPWRSVMDQSALHPPHTHLSMSLPPSDPLPPPPHLLTWSPMPTTACETTHLSFLTPKACPLQPPQQAHGLHPSRHSLSQMLCRAHLPDPAPSHQPGPGHPVLPVDCLLLRVMPTGPRASPAGIRLDAPCVVFPAPHQTQIPRLLGRPSCRSRSCSGRPPPACVPASQLGGTSLRVSVEWCLRRGLLKHGHLLRERSVTHLKCPAVSLTVPPHPLTLKYWLCRTEGLAWDRAGVPAGWCGALRARAARAQDGGSAEPPQDPALHPFSSNVVDAQHKLCITGSAATCPVQRHWPCSHHSTYFWNVPITTTKTTPPLAVSTPHHTLLPGKPLIYFLSLWVIRVNGIIKHEVFMSGFFHSA
ncbi:uncharacterized protein LOC116626292 [Phoca vitulina]|uniref:uncharacterized protein LOC116626292 n=1 Tax=Phoca vitulina TaxID=9720 RepID=UPI001395E6A9|nr:uncharacterized protein LOC116626292 [Phoca vitulina]